MICPKCNSEFSGGEVIDTPLGEVKVCDQCCVWDQFKGQVMPLIPCPCGEDFLDLEVKFGEYRTSDHVILRNGEMWNHYCWDEFESDMNQRILDSIVDAGGWAEA
jgi:hypothetical protein